MVVLLLHNTTHHYQALYQISEILTQIVAEKCLTEKNVYMYNIRVKEGKNEKRRQNEDKHLNFSLHSTLCLPEDVHKI